MKEKIHTERLNAQVHASTLPTAEKVLAAPSRMDSCTDAKIRTCAFLAEHCLPFSLAPDLISFCQKMAQEPKALDRLSMCRKTATYTTTHGVAAALKEDLFEKLHTRHFSLNIDEATNNANNKIVNVVVRYYDEERGEVVTKLFGSFKENVSNTPNIFAGLWCMLDKNDPDATEPDPSKQIPFKNIVSCLMDNCNVMRGEKKGVEAILRRKNPDLLDIHGDTVHIVSNAAKSLCVPFESYAEEFANDIYYDFKLSPKATHLFKEDWYCKLFYIVCLFHCLTSS